ncbi:hypothetical protein GF318_00285 [Candidatus Micrarchaeota archaeon]|nr:hypothetical protein [Candidatus Micrarchaeota archaeon]
MKQTLTGNDSISKKGTFPSGYSPMVDTLKKARTGRPTTKRNIPAIIDDIRHGGPVDRWFAVMEVHDIAKDDPEKAKQALPALFEAFRKWGDGTKCIVAETLKVVGDPKALHVLVAAAKHKSDEVRVRVMDAIASIPTHVVEVIEG